ncbi:hypothetical protein OPV22_022414 [Ensete ventricosum]|uniref:Uncharacterized protein n=1 Tax=Ensete ventricosum TaxID=4639 RepID=A0AAV8QSU3_ENSVE|nr:hypothetical protein OPV22_022414 [Ensete ventricosum]
MERFPSPTPRARSFLRCPFFLLMTEIADPATPDLRTDLGKLTSLQVLDLVDYSVIFGARLCFTGELYKAGRQSNTFSCQSRLL